MQATLGEMKPLLMLVKTCISKLCLRSKNPRRFSAGSVNLVDFHAPTNPIFWPGVSLFLLLFETQTAWELLKTDLAGLLTATGFDVSKPTFYAGGSLQVIQARK